MSGNGPESMLALPRSCDLGEPATEVLAVRKETSVMRKKGIEAVVNTSSVSRGFGQGLPRS